MPVATLVDMDKRQYSCRRDTGDMGVDRTRRSGMSETGCGNAESNGANCRDRVARGASARTQCSTDTGEGASRYASSVERTVLFSKTEKREGPGSTSASGRRRLPTSTPRRTRGRGW